QGGIRLERLLDERVERRRMEQRPPLPWDVQALHKALFFAAGDGRRRGLRRQGLRRIAVDGWSGGTFEIRPDRASREQACNRQSRNRQVSISLHSPLLVLEASPPDASMSARSRLERNIMQNAGTTTSSMIGPMNRPPTTTVARGRCTWLPIPVEIAAGNKPMHAD